VRVSPDTYMLYREDHAGIFGNATAMKANVIREANEFAEKQGKIVVPVLMSETPMGNGPAQWAKCEYQFRVVDKDDPEVGRTSLVTTVNQPQGGYAEENPIAQALTKVGTEFTEKAKRRDELREQEELIRYQAQQQARYNQQVVFFPNRSSSSPRNIYDNSGKKVGSLRDY